MDAFKLKKDGKILDYRLAGNLDLTDIRKELEGKYKVGQLRQEGRHVIGVVEREGQEYFLKLATSEGISARTQIDKLWNDEFNKYSKSEQFRVPKNFDDGLYKDFYYIIVEKFNGPLLCKLDGSNNTIGQHVEQIIEFSELIQGLPINVSNNDLIEESNHQKWFVAKTKSWLDAIPKEIVQKYGVERLFEIVERGASVLEKKPRHGDFTPWHLILLSNNGLGLIDGEHAHSHGVEYYDICYFIQRVFSIIDDRKLAIKIYGELLNRGYDKGKLKTVLTSRAIGGFLDESLNPSRDYKSEVEFKNWVLEL